MSDNPVQEGTQFILELGDHAYIQHIHFFKALFQEFHDFGYGIIFEYHYLHVSTLEM